jgi:ribA/ribD-fused uncharacterized protein
MASGLEGLNIDALIAQAKTRLATAAPVAPKPKLTLAAAKAAAATKTKTRAVAAPSLIDKVTDTLRAVTEINPAGKVPTDQELQDFYKKRKKHPERYTIDPKGNLVIRSRTGAVEKVYTIPVYRQPTISEIKDVEDARREAVRGVEQRYEEAVTELRQRMDEYKRGESSAGDVVAANTRLANLDAERHTVMFPLEGIKTIEGVETRRVLFDQKDNIYKLTLDLPMRRTLTLQQQYVREGEEVLPEAPVAPAPAAAAAAGIMQGGNQASFSEQLARDKGIVAFANPEDNENGFLSTFWPVEFTLGGVRYFTVEQAVAAEKARAFHEDALRTEILKTRAPRTMRTKANAIIPKSVGETGGLPVPRLDEWENTLRMKVLKDATMAKFKQHPELADKLLLTGDKSIVLADTREKKDGIALALTDPKIANSAEWRGGNLYGKILMEVRGAIRDERTGGGDDKEITEETVSSVAYTRDRERSERGAVIHAMRR